VKALSISRALLPALNGPELTGIAIGSGFLDFGTFAVALTRPGGPRMPNGVETDLPVGRGIPVRIGGGRLLLGTFELAAGPVWEPVPEVLHRPARGTVPGPDPDRLAGRGPGLTPAGDDILCGYVAGLFLFHRRREEAAAIAARAATRTTLLSATLLRHAAIGELPEPAHAFLATGDTGPLAGFGHSSGRCLLEGLRMAAA
jgi:hypothetical protein